MKKMKFKKYNHKAGAIYEALGLTHPDELAKHGALEPFLEIEKHEQKKDLTDSERVEIASKFLKDPMRARAILNIYLNMLHYLLSNDTEKLQMLKHTIYYLINMEKG